MHKRIITPSRYGEGKSCQKDRVALKAVSRVELVVQMWPDSDLITPW